MGDVDDDFQPFNRTLYPLFDGSPGVIILPIMLLIFNVCLTLLICYKSVREEKAIKEKVEGAVVGVFTSNNNNSVKSNNAIAQQ